MRRQSTKAAYTGLLKHLFDLIDQAVLAGRPVVLAATGGSDRHALVIEHHLRPLFAFFGAHALPAGLYATNADFISSDQLAVATEARISRLVDQLDAWVKAAPQAGTSAGPRSGRVA